MTTIAYKDGIIAYDGRTTSGDGEIILTDDAVKHVKREGVIFFICGFPSDIDLFIDYYFGKNKSDLVPQIEAFIFDGKDLYHSSVDPEGNFWKIQLNYARAIGSGKKFAFTAMDMGATAEEAIKMAIKRDPNSGGTIRTFRIFEEGEFI